MPHTPGTQPPTAPPPMDDDIIEDNADKIDAMAPSPPDGMNEEATLAQADEDEGTIAERIMRRRHNTAAVVAPDLLQEPTTPFTINLCSGIQRD
eukprot:4893042-Pleurochrysis_carterae.AAC.1